MSDQAPYIPPQGPPQVRLSPEIFQAMGEDGFYRMSRDFYTELEASSIRPLFPENMAEASKKQAMFLIQASGGPALYVRAHGPPRMRVRHLPFAIGQVERDIWRACFEKVLEHASDYGMPPQHLADFKEFLDGFSTWMMNRAPEGSS